MRPLHSLKEFKKRLSKAGFLPQHLTPRQGIDVMLDFYAQQRASGCIKEESGDMLLFQWGTYDWGGGRQFEVDITRQFITDAGEDDDIWQLHLTFRIPPAPDLESLGAGNRWCEAPRDIDGFRSYVFEAPPMKHAKLLEALRAELTYERAG